METFNGNKGETMLSFRENIELLIQNGKTREAAEQLLDAVKHQDRALYSKLLILSGELKELKLDYSVGKIRHEDYRTALVKIQSSLLEINDYIPNEILGRIKITNLPDRDWLFLSVAADYVNDVVSLIEDNDRKPFLNLVLGMAGIGKTYLARKVALKYSVEQRERFDVIWFINSESVESIIGDLKDLGTYFNVIYQGDNDLFLKSLKKTLTDSELTWLIVFDNACDRSTNESDPKMFADKYFPRTEFPKQIIVTSQNIDWVYVFAPRKHIKLKNWELSDYLDFLNKNDIINSNNTEIQFLHTEFGGLPLAIAQAVGYIKKKNITVGRYIELLHVNKKRLLQEKEIAIDYKNSVFNAVTLSFESLQNSAKDLLVLISFFSPDNIPIHLLFNNIRQKSIKSYLDVNNPFRDAFDLEDAKSELLNYYIAEQLNVNNETVSIHRIIKLAIQIYIYNTDIFAQYLKESTKIINETFDIIYSKIDVDEFEHFEVLLPHILSVLANCITNIDKLDGAIIDAATLSFKLGKYYIRLGNDHESLSRLKEAKHFNEYNDNFFNEILNARISLQIGHLYYLSDERDSSNNSIPLFEYSNDVFQKNNLLVESSRCVNNIGSIYLMRRDYENAIFWYKKGISVSEESFLHHNLGYVYQSIGNYDLAIEHYNTSLELSTQTKSNHRIGINYHLLGIVYGLCSNFLKQNEYHNKCLALYREMQQSRRISYCLFQMINFSMDRKEYNNIINHWYAEHKKYYEFVSEDSEYLLNSLILQCRFAMLDNESFENILLLYKKVKDNQDILLSYPTDSHTTSAYLDFAIYFYNNKDFSKAVDAIEHAVNFIENRVYHRRDELNQFFNILKNS